MSIIVGIDLHGTLINNEEKFCDGSEIELEAVLKAKPQDVKLYICTGNDLPFIERKIGRFYNYFDGAVLETGCTVNTKEGCETILVSAEATVQIKKIEQELIGCNFPQVYKFARRLATISMFTKYGESLEDFYQLIKQKLANNHYCRVTRSSVAVDLIPIGFDKFSGLSHFADTNDQIAALADSLNDLELLKKADISLLPGNHHPDLPQSIDESAVNLKIFQGEATFGVIEALKYIYSLSKCD